MAPTGCHALGTLILMFDGTLKPVETVVVGDVLMGPGSAPRRVLELHRGRDEMVEVRPLKGDPFTVNLGHVLTLVRTNEGNGKRGPNREGQLIDIGVSEWLASSDTFRHLHKLLRLPADFPERTKPNLDPYFLGVLIGDGSLCKQVSVTTPDVEIVDALQQFASRNGLRLRSTNSFCLGRRRMACPSLCPGLRHQRAIGGQPETAIQPRSRLRLLHRRPEDCP